MTACVITGLIFNVSKHLFEKLSVPVAKTKAIVCKFEIKVFGVFS
jgi:hypothetical protein